MPPERTIRRQEPASCESCRKKKLRCDRGLPCHNCQTRSIQCEYQGRRPPTTVEQPSHIPSSSQPDLAAENATIKARLARLEEAVYRNGFATSTPPSAVSEAAPVSYNAGLRSPVTPQVSSPEPEHVKGYCEDSKWLDVVMVAGTGQLPYLARDTHVEILPLNQITAIVGSEVLSKGSLPARIMLPSQDQSQYLFECYNESLDALQHVIYVPTVKRIIDSLYETFDTKVPHYSHVVLLLAILGSIAAFWALGSPEKTLFASQQEALAMSKYWLRCTLDISEQCWRTSKPDLEFVQGKIILMFVIYHLEGFTPQARYLHASAIASAREIGLFVTDGRQRKVRQETQAQIIDLEFRRRVMWHLASTDWSIAVGGNPDDGLYSVQPDQLTVNKPRNINDDDLVTQPANFERPLSELTSCSYYLRRIKLGEVCREVADLMREMYAVPIEQIPYEHIIHLDNKFSALLDSLPVDLQLDNLKLSSNDLSDVPRPLNVKQAYFTFLTVEARRCKLHLPYLLRVKQNNRYKYSRSVCLQAARNILRLRHVQPTSSTSPGNKITVLGILCHFFGALVVLVMDICVNPEPEHHEERKAEIRDASTILEEAKGTSNAAHMYHDSLMAMLKKYNVCQRHEQGRLEPRNSALPNAKGEEAIFREREPSIQPMDLNPDFDIDDLWQSTFDFGADSDLLLWTNLLTELEQPVA
ncbi:hypothetical protein BAUCODRAFT_20800 [Baudoinia panamericana UAMH 10762]|uniref:Zn(2)-C6 fungal-type domain-containing protein n=1 Tax=Baudoinia panamericana (strain UAMH 10762) TaxID=717646 RepID=M2M148_BAUPA|nr:uncharacterized protein BAUCODRAFT_20800 [Baudoinia panamericana UAMH 10762]EMD00763.1 hypothetical protein BAUCODRAFT_20800 [Baudoinia panamericana UAMH 10762]